MGKKDKFAVVETYSYYPATKVYVFENYDEAYVYMKKVWEACRDNERKYPDEKYRLDEYNTYCEEFYAQLWWTDNDYRSWQVVEISEPVDFHNKI